MAHSAASSQTMSNLVWTRKPPSLSRTIGNHPIGIRGKSLEISCARTRFQKAHIKNHNATVSGPNAVQGRINPNFPRIRDYFSGIPILIRSHQLILAVCEAFYSAVATFLPKAEMNSKRQRYDIVNRMIPDWFSMLTYISHYRCPKRAYGRWRAWSWCSYVIAWLGWLGSYEMNL
jgi:hypothetical protein